MALMPLVVVMGLRFTVGVRDGDRSKALLGLAAGLLITAFVCVVSISLYNRKLHRLTALAGSSSWGAPCVDPDNLRAWEALLVDAAGVRVVGRSGVVRRDWKWESIRDVTVERFPVALVTHMGVVLHLADDSNAELLLPSRTTLAYPLARAEAAANEIRQRLDVFRARSSSFEAPSQ